MRQFLWLPVFLCLGAGLLSAQVTGRLTGSVLDASGAAIPGAAARLTLPGGQTAIAQTTTNSDGMFVLPAVAADTYDVTIEASGFQTAVLRRVKVDAARDTALAPVKLDVAAVSQSVEVTGGAQTAVQTTTTEISTTVSNEQVRDLPVLDRQVFNLLTTQAGVTDGRGPTVINGQRTSFASVTVDGINVQDNLFRDNALNFAPNRLTIDQVSEITVSTSNAGTTASGGSAQVAMVTRGGSNEFHGSGYWYNRNNAVAANDWFNNLDGVDKPFLNQNQFGASLGGPVIKDKLLFFFNYEALRNRQQSLANRAIPTAEARQGIFTYRDSGGAVKKANVLQLGNVSIDPAMADLLKKVPGPENINNYRLGDSRADYVGNTGGYSFNTRNNESRNNITARGDYIHSTSHVFSGSLLWNDSRTDRPDLATDYDAIPSVYTVGGATLLSLGWRWNPAPTLTNELRGGFNQTYVDFLGTKPNPTFLLATAGLMFASPENQYEPQGRQTDTYSISDTANWVRGRHDLQFGGVTNQIRTAPYNSGGITPTYTLGISTGNPNGLSTSQLPGIRSSDLPQANLLLADLAGYIDTFAQRLNVKDRSSGYVPGYTELRHWSLNSYAGFVVDRWKVNRRLMATLGLRYEYYGRVDERDALNLMPVLQGSYIQTLLSNATLDFAGGAVNRPLYGRDMNNFAPSLGLAWDVFGDGRTAVRAGYSISYVNDTTIAAVRNNVQTNRGLNAELGQGGLNARLSVNAPTAVAPAFKVPRTVEDNFLLAPTTNAIGMPDPNLRTPYVQQWTAGIQQELKGFVFEARYVGNKLTKALRAFDYNQVVINENGFLADFKRAQQNALLAGGNPNYNPAIAGSQPLTVFPLLANGGNLNNSTNRSLITQGQAGELAYRYQIARTNGSVQFFRNPYSLGTNVITNYSNSSYNALQLEVRRSSRKGLHFQLNYSFSKVLSDALGDTQTRFEAFMDMANPQIERARAPFDINHAGKANFVYDLPLGKGRLLHYQPLDRVLSGWRIGGAATLQSGTPFSVYSLRGTVNRSGRSAQNTANTALDADGLKDVVGFWMTGDGPMFINPAAIGPDGRGVASDGQPQFAGQAFTNPGAGQNGGLQRRMFTGPSAFNLDLALQKVTVLREGHTIELRAEAFNATNTPSFYVGDESSSNTRFNINATTFGLIPYTMYSPREVQFGLYYRF